jgi:hypothetical protein
MRPYEQAQVSVESDLKLAVADKLRTQPITREKSHHNSYADLLELY